MFAPFDTIIETYNLTLCMGKIFMHGENNHAWGK